MNTISRRKLIKGTSAGLVLAGAGSTQLGWAQVDAGDTLDASPLIYLSPLHKDGALSRCQAEVWYVAQQGEMFVVTDKESWRAEALTFGLNQAQIWIGDVGRWQRAGGRYKELPGMVATASFETNATRHAELLEHFGRKYPDEWGSWGPRFRKGLARGSRVMLKYVPAKTG